MATAAQADPASRLLASSGEYYDLDEDDEGLLLAEWQQHIGPFKTVEAVEGAAARLAAASDELDESVRAARAAGASWADIGRAAGMTRQSANERWAGRLRA